MAMVSFGIYSLLIALKCISNSYFLTLRVVLIASLCPLQQLPHLDPLFDEFVDVFGWSEQLYLENIMSSKPE